jgi:hypothetical protein
MIAVVNLDLTAPVIAFSGNAGTYTVDQIVNISCKPSDALSGLASSSCPGANGPAYSFPLGANQLSAMAMDRAGNQQNATTSFSVSVTFDSLANLTKQFVSQPGVANSMNAKLAAAAAAAGRGDMNAKAGAIGAYENELSAQTGKAIGASEAAMLKGFADSL